MNKRRSSRQQTPYRSSLPLLLYDLTAASQVLPPAAVLPEQFHGSAKTTDSTRGEVALMRAVLEDAINCFQKRDPHHPTRLAREAEQWIFADEFDWPFSFLNICSILGLDPDYLRLGLKRWQQNPAARPLKRPRRGVLERKTVSLAA